MSKDFVGTKPHAPCVEARRPQGRRSPVIFLREIPDREGLRARELQMSSAPGMAHFTDLWALALDAATENAKDSACTGDAERCPLPPARMGKAFPSR
jgi:hypothetical protein